MTKVSPITIAVFVTILGAGHVACEQPPAGPSRMANPGGLDPESVNPARPQVQLTGLVVDGNGRSVAEARVGASYNGRTLGETVADTAGVYTLTIDRLDSVEVHVEKEGFEASLFYVFPGSSNAEELTTSLRLHEILRISAGKSVELSVVEGDPSCDDLEGWPCRRVRVVSPVAGQLVVEVPLESVTPYFLIRLSGPPYYDYRSFFRIAIAAGSETILDVMLIGGRPGRTTTLTTRLEPS